MELEPIESLGYDPESFEFLNVGVGPVEAAVNLTEYLCRVGPARFSGVINVGLAGAYPDSDARLLDICLAEHERFGDIGICFDERIDELAPSFAPPLEYTLDPELLAVACGHLENAGFTFLRGNFVTVSSVSGTSRRGSYLCSKFKAICENMEGASTARVCREFSLPCLEIRCISNMIVDRDDQEWRASEAVEICGKAVQTVMEGLKSD